MWTVKDIKKDLKLAKKLKGNYTTFDQLKYYNDSIKDIKTIINDYKFKFYNPSNIIMDSIKDYNKFNGYHKYINEFSIISNDFNIFLNTPNNNIIYEPTNMTATEDEILSITHDFYKTMPNSLYQTFLKIFSYKNKNINFLEFNEEFQNIMGQTIYIPLVNKIYFEINMDNDWDIPLTTIHEYAHGISYYLTNDIFNNDYLFSEVEAIFIELLANDYLSKYLNINNKQLHRDFFDDKMADYESLMTATNILKNIINPLCLNDTQKELICDYNSDLTNVLSYITAIELYMIYKNDPEKAFYLHNEIMFSKNNDNVLKMINLNECVSEYTKILMK